ncbi:MAG TPA: SRPBCC domain-containing protein [Chthoniobacterales bacterium]|nr:SRPBCC domain-containing protein [Chthoniobacterales bacterium]
MLHHGATGGASGPLEEGKTVIWQFGDFPGEAPVSVKKEIPSELIVFEWAAAESKDEDLLANKMHKAKDYNTRVEIKFESLDPESTLVKISESRWKEDQSGLESSYGNCMGWSQMISCLKAYVEYGINLRRGFY